MHALGCAAHRVLLAAAAELDAREAWRADGARSMADWLCLRLGVTRATALRWVEAARKLGELPALASAYAAGRVGFERMCALAELATPETEQELLETTEAMGTPALQLQARRARGVRLREAARAQAGRYLHLRHEHEQGVVLLRGSLPAEAGALVGRALDRIVESMPRVSGPFDPPEARRADALVALASARVAADADPDRACVVVHVEAGALSGAEEGVAEVEGGGPASRRGRPQAGVRRPPRGGGRGRGGPHGGGGAAHPPGARLARSPDPPPGPRVPLPRVRGATGGGIASHRALGPGRKDRPRQPCLAMPPPPRAGARGGVGAPGGPPRGADLRPARWR